MSNITVFKRRLTTHEVIKTWGLVDKGEVLSRLSRKLDLPKDKLEGNLRNDLKFLVKERQIEQIAFDKFGHRLGPCSFDTPNKSYLDYPDLSSFKWRAYDDNDTDGRRPVEIPGAPFLKQFGANLECTENLYDIIKMKEGRSNSKYKSLAIHFELNHQLFHIEVNLESLTRLNLKDDLHFIVARSGQDNRKFIKETFYEYGPCCALLELKNSFLGSLRNGKDGHFMISVNSKGEVFVKDLGTKNGTMYSGLSADKKNEMLEELSFHDRHTRTHHWCEDLNLSLNAIDAIKPILLRERSNLVSVKDRVGFIITF